MVEVKVVSQRFSKFFNFGEALAAEIDWSTARVTEKCDGSIIGGWYDEEKWHFSTNGVINAFDCDLQMPKHDCSSFGELFMIAACETTNMNWGEFLKSLDSNIMYTWELCTPWNRVVVPHRTNKIYLIGARDGKTLQEIDVWVEVNLLPKVPRPQVYSMTTPDEILSAIALLPYSEEGYVVMDSHFNRTKWKGQNYLAAHHLKNNGVVSLDRAFEIVKKGEQDEFLAYFPEYKSIFDEVAEKYRHTLIMIGAAQASAEGWKKECATKKEFAMRVLNEDVHLRAYMFAVWDDKEIDLSNISYDKLF